MVNHLFCSLATCDRLNRRLVNHQSVKYRTVQRHYGVLYKWKTTECKIESNDFIRFPSAIFLKELPCPLADLSFPLTTKIGLCEPCILNSIIKHKLFFLRKVISSVLQLVNIILCYCTKPKRVYPYICEAISIPLGSGIEHCED